VQATPLLVATQFAPPLQGSGTDTDLAIGDLPDWSARWAGQLYAAVPGQYTVRVDSDDGDRLFLGTAPVAEISWARNDSNGSSSTATTAALREGWNDLVIDYNQVGGTTLFGVRLIASPDPALTLDSPLPLAQLRPVEPRGERLIVRTTPPGNTVAVAEDTAVFSDLLVSVSAQPNQIVTRVDITVSYISDEPDQLLFRVVRPGGTPVIVLAHPSVAGGTRMLTHAFSIDPALVGGPADGVWSVGIADDVDGLFNSDTSIAEAHLTLHTSGGPEQIARNAVWRTPIKDLGTQLVKIDALTWDDRAPAGTAVELRLRSCAQADCSDETSWGEPLANGMPVILPQRRYLQAQVSMTSDGTNEPELRSLRIMYRRASM